MENLVNFRQYYAGRRVWISGHTGFKGSWLALWLNDLGASVSGYALTPPTTPSHFEALGLEDLIEHEIGDVRNLQGVAASVSAASPDIVFHLAAQPLVRMSYDCPLDTLSTNIMGTAHVLDAVRLLDKPCAVVVVTTDKVYENAGTGLPYRETDQLGGHDCYSASKAAAEIVTSAYARSFFHGKRGVISAATARAGNVIGGGDWAGDRIVPDCIRHLMQGRPVPVRNPLATRPWQHVLEPLGGYLQLGARLLGGDAFVSGMHLGLNDAAFNFGPGPGSERSVRELVENVLLRWPGSWIDRTDTSAVHEASNLALSIDKAESLLQWSPLWGFEEAVSRTVDWYRDAQDCRTVGDFRRLTRAQIEAYTECAALK